MRSHKVLPYHWHMAVIKLLRNFISFEVKKVQVLSALIIFCYLIISNLIFQSFFFFFCQNQLFMPFWVQDDIFVIYDQRNGVYQPILYDYGDLSNYDVLLGNASRVGSHPVYCDNNSTFGCHRDI